MEKLPATLEMGAVRLLVADRDTMVSFYQDAVGLEHLGEHGNEVFLGRNGKTTLVLDHQPSLRHAGPREAGLFHTAFLFDSPTELSAAVWSVAQKNPDSFTGSADHIVSEAFYFDDPEGNGVELYADRDRSTWTWSDLGITMDTLPLDPNGYLKKHLQQTSLEPSSIGHVHLCVGDLDQAKAFYVDTLGFEQTLNFHGSALFVSAGGYHHHMAMNIWRSRGASRRLQTLGLGNVDIHLGSDDELAAVRDRLEWAGYSVEDDGNTLAVDDPWGNRVTLH